MSQESKGRAAVVGAGAIGGFLAAALAEAGRDVALCVRTPIDRLVVERGGTAREAAVEIVSEPARLAPVPWLFLAVKAQDVDAARPWLAATDAPETQVVVVQNGIGHDRVRHHLSQAATIPAIIYCGVERVAPGHVVHHGNAKIIVPRSEASRRLAAFFAGSCFEIVEEDDFVTAAWRKLLSNVVWNPITALTLRRAGILREPAIQDLARELLAEAVAVGQAEGARLTEADIDGLVSGMAGAGATSGSSMLYDRLAGRPLEHEHITGAIVERAARQGIAVPLNRAILALLAGASGRPLDASA